MLFSFCIRSLFLIICTIFDYFNQLIYRIISTKYIDQQVSLSSQKKQRMFEDKNNDIDLSFLDQIQPPSTYPLTVPNILENIQASFFNQCSKFLETQYRFYTCSKKIQNKLVTVVEGTQSIHKKFTETSQDFQRIARGLKKFNDTQILAKQKQQFLQGLCEIIKMDKYRDILLNESKINEQDQQPFLRVLEELNTVVQDIEMWQSDVPIIIQLQQQLTELLEQVVKKLIKQKLSDSMIEKIIGPYSAPFLRGQNIATIFKNNLKNNRLNHFRIGLNPLINNIFYAQNIADLYKMIVEEWVRMLEEELKLFGHKNIPEELKEIPIEIMSIIVKEVVPKLERNIYKIKDIQQIAKIRFYLFSLKKKLLEVAKNDWDPLPKFLVKSHILLEEKLDYQGEQLQIAKYNIYSLSSYIPIREHLERIKTCISYDIDDGSEAKIQWERAFEKLANSRQPWKQPKNKSLIIFNLNIWYIYEKIITKGQVSENAAKIIKWCRQNFVELNINEVKKLYSSMSFQNLLDICSNIQALKKKLYAEVYLLGHESLRMMIQEAIRQQFIKNFYEPILQRNKITDKGLTVAQLLKLAQSHKINLNKYGKMSEKLEVPSVENLQHYLE